MRDLKFTFSAQGCVVRHATCDPATNAPLAGGAKVPGEDVRDDLVKISVGQDDAVVFRSAHALQALAVARAARVNELPHSRRADKAHRQT